jgi:lysophospholipid acyltransferase
LNKKVKARTGSSRPDLRRNESQESLQGATLGVPVNPGQEFDDMVDEIVAEVNRRRLAGNADQNGPVGPELRKMVAETLKRTTSQEGVKKEL